MIQKTYEISDRARLAGILAEIRKSAAYSQGQKGLLQLFTSRIGREELQAMRREILRVLPGVELVGMSLTLFDQGNDGQTNQRWYMILNCNFFQTGEIRVWEIPLQDLRDYPDSVPDLNRQLGEIPDLKGVEVLYAGTGIPISSFLEQISMEHEAVPFFGAGASNMVPEHTYAPCDNLFAQEIDWDAHQYVAAGKIYTEGVVLIAFAGKNLSVKADYLLGWKPIGRELGITRTLGNRCIATIDDLPAAGIYEKYLKVQLNGYFTYNICEFPLIIERQGTYIARVPPLYDTGKNLYFTGDVHEGEKIRFSYAKPDDLLQETWRASEAMKDFSPEGMFLFLCGNRTLFLQDKASQEILDYRRLCPDTAVCNGVSEIYRRQGRGGLLNSALVAVGIREGTSRQVETVKVQKPQRQEPQSAIIPLTTRLAAFLGVLTSELEQSNAELKKMAIRAKAGSAAKSQFLSNMSHEIRTPINAILGMDEMILREASEPAILAYAENIHTAWNSLLGIINDILDFSKIEAGKMDIIPVEYSLRSVLNDLVNMVQIRAQKKGLHFVVEASPELPSTLYGDEIRLKQVVTNLLTNAVKYTPEGQVTLQIAYEKISDKAIRLKMKVSDTGIGIKEEDQRRLFHAFERIDEARNRTIEGTGLGMNITQYLLKLMGTSLQVASVYGEGSTFSFAVEQGVLRWAPIGNFEEAYRNTLVGHKQYHQKFTAPSADILIVDDTVMNLMMIRGLLKKTQLKIDTAESGPECLEKLQKKRYDLIFLDHRMPGMDGIETLQAMQTLAQNQNVGVAVIALTANAISGAREEYIKAGFTDYLTKPIDSARLEDMLMKYLPEEKVIRTEDPEDVVPSSNDGGEDIPEAALQAAGLHFQEGIRHCGSFANYFEALKIFFAAITSGADEIEGYFQAADWENYTIKVHALKSTARIIGAEQLSEEAACLEAAGDREDTECIREKTPLLLQHYREFLTRLAPLFPAEEPMANKPMIALEDLEEAYETLQEVAESFDFDTVQFILQELTQYQIPVEERPRYEKILQAAKEPDWDTLNELLK